MSELWLSARSLLSFVSDMCLALFRWFVLGHEVRRLGKYDHDGWGVVADVFEHRVL